MSKTNIFNKKNNVNIALTLINEHKIIAIYGISTIMEANAKFHTKPV